MSVFRLIPAVLVTLALLCSSFAAAAMGDFSITVRDDVITHPVFGIYVLPGEKLPIALPAGQASVTAAAGKLTRRDGQHWNWQAPKEPGVYPVIASRKESENVIRLNVFVMTPYDHADGELQGYRIGEYEEKALRGDPAYARPAGFIKVTDANRDLKVSPHFTLGQFLCKQKDGPPQFLVLRERLLLKLEIILDRLNASGLKLDTLFVMSGYRTPWYNQRIGNRTRYSRHLYGGAADIFPDADNDGIMDDINGDGFANRADAEMLAEMIAGPVGDGSKKLVGGLGIYGPAPHRGPFVHVDVRGYPARW